MAVSILSTFALDSQSFRLSGKSARRSDGRISKQYQAPLLSAGSDSVVWTQSNKQYMMREGYFQNHLLRWAPLLRIRAMISIQVRPRAVWALVLFEVSKYADGPHIVA